MQLKPSSQDSGKSAMDKMNPERLQQFLQDAQDGKFGPDAQKMAQGVMSEPQGAMPPQGDDDGDEGGDSSMPAKKDYSSIFSGGAAPAAAPAAPANRASMFQRG